MHKITGDLLDTNMNKRDSKWIFVMSTSKKHYIGEVEASILVQNLRK